MSAASTRKGGCLCGRVRFTARGEPVTNAYCHCPSCRRAAGAPVVAWAMYPLDQVTFDAEPPARYESSPGAVRGFCQRCSTSLSFEGELISGLIDLTVASFDDAAELAPDLHVWHRYRLPWLTLDDEGVRFEELPPGPPS